MEEPEKKTDLFWFKRKCRLLEIELSPKREIVAQFIVKESGAFYAEELWGKIRVHQQKLSMATVYHALALFAQGGLLEIRKNPGERNCYKCNCSRIMDS